MSDDTPDAASASPTPGPAASRRVGLWLALLAALIGLLAARADLRVPAGELAASSARSLIYDGLDLSPRTVYAWRLWLAGLDDSPLARRWRSAVDDATPETLGARERLRLDFAADEVRARVLRADLGRGEALSWRLVRASPETGRLYADLEYRADDEADWRMVRRLVADGETHQFTVGDTGEYRLVFQPELFAEVNAWLAVTQGGSIPMPVVGAQAYDIGGGFGAPRGGGSRRHKGVDIFADRGTPVRAVTDGGISLRNGGLGGKAIFLSSGWAGPRYYYAHLDSVRVADGARVSRGDIIGTVGNTGNAAGGPPHLHFGIYATGGAIDPAPFIRPMPSLPDLPNAG